MTKEDILYENPDFEEKFKELVSLEDIMYYYHITPNNADEICEDGLYLLENRLSSTTIKIPEEFIKDPIEYALHERGEGYRKNASIVLLGIPEDEVDYAIEKNRNKPSNWNEFEYPEFLIPPHYIVGYIDTNDFNIIINPKYELLNEYESFNI